MKSRIIPFSWKGNIDNIIEQELVGANRYFAETNPRLGELIANAAMLPPQDFYNALRERWDWHNVFFEELLEPALPLLVEPQAQQLSPLQVSLLRDVYETGSLVDQATLVVSAAIKKHVDHWMDVLPECTVLTNEDRYLFTGLNGESYSVRYTIDHLNYLASVKEGIPVDEIRQKLVERYHSGDEQIFAGRIRQFLSTERDARHLRKRIARLRSKRNQRIQHFYLLTERPRLKAMCASLAYDNNEEKQVARELIGISGFLIRKAILGYLTETNILASTNGIYGQTDEVVCAGLAQLEQRQRNRFVRSVTPYTQSGFTCGAACLTMAMAYFQNAAASRATEDDVAATSGSYFTSGQHFSGLALKALSAGFEVKLLHTSTEMFDNTNRWLRPEQFESLMLEYKAYLKKARTYPSFSIENGVEITSGCVRKCLEDGYLVIAAGILPPNTLHAILVDGYESDDFHVIDPLVGKSGTKSASALEAFMETKIGRWVLALRPIHGPADELYKKLELFKSQAKAYLV